MLLSLLNVIVARSTLAQFQLQPPTLTFSMPALPSTLKGFVTLLAAVDLQGDLVRFLKEFLRDAEHCELVICRSSLGQAGLHDKDSNRDPTSPAEVSDLNQAFSGTDLEASGSAAFDPQRFTLEQMCEEVSPTIFVVQPKDASLRLTADLIHVPDPRTGLRPARILAVVEVDRYQLRQRQVVKTDPDNVGRLPFAVVVHEDLVALRKHPANTP